MKILRFSALVGFMLCFLMTASAQSTKNDIPVSKLPTEVKSVLEEYVKILRLSPSLDDCALKVMNVAGGSLVNESGTALRSTIQPYSLKKDYENVKFYADPIKITRVNLSKTAGDGFGESALAGKVYKIWIAKKDGGAGLPAPITIVVPEGHATITSPKVTGIGSL